MSGIQLRSFNQNQIKFKQNSQSKKSDVKVNDQQTDVNVSTGLDPLIQLDPNSEAASIHAPAILKGLNFAIKARMAELEKRIAEEEAKQNKS